jgi:hypothetical protein
MGKCFSICDAMEYERQQELAESRVLDYEQMIRTVPKEGLKKELALIAKSELVKANPSVK